ncbi:MAG: phosphoribosylamine--glycine ligase [Pseudomonadota bacterium]
MTRTVKTILLLGSGGREHALAWKMAQSDTVETISVLPGSDAIACVGKVRCVPGDSADVPFVVETARELKPDLIVVGPEKPLAAGVADALGLAGFAVLGPDQNAARLESSKIFAKEFMVKFGIPTAEFKVYDTYDDAVAAIKSRDVKKEGVVIKADGLASGKGVVVTHDPDEALKAVHDFMINPACIIKSDKLLVEDIIRGKEVSAFALCDGEVFLPLGYVCDNKRIRDGDEGPNTGGMGGTVPKGWPSPGTRRFINENIFRRTVEGMLARGTPFKGILFAGLMIDGEDVKVLEFNTRFGDPETQILLPLLQGDIVPLLDHAARGTLHGAEPPALSGEEAVHVVMTSEGYPEITGTGMRLGAEISFPEKMLEQKAGDSTLLFIAGAKKQDGRWVNSGGRVLGVTGLGETKEEARARAYGAVEDIRFEGAHWRKDIGR